MSLFHTLRDRLFLWRKRQAPGDDLTADGCFTLPGARLDDDGTAACEADPVAPAGAADTAG
ncbi:MAG: hypothetical protein OEY41_03615 [Acidimicrobiia bacterium]|nr:hypothetical protein [Acidimicrobiia bacterium]MDH4363361.1 hypothetical protein [Acidimicrobiia bacterium]MDH5289069.1 hypothetical protein [Acidimicrobiia bacterium]